MAEQVFEASKPRTRQAGKAVKSSPQPRKSGGLTN
jgi:hypothetical protein